MLFNSFEFLIFFVLVYIVYWVVAKKNLKLQNGLLFIASYFFYGWWDWRFLFLLALSTFIDYIFGLLVSKNRKRLYLWLSVFFNLIILCVFKYYNFFAESLKELMEGAGMHVSPYILSIALPVGISFYTFHGMSYVFDIYNGKVKPTKNYIDYSLFVSFFPLLVAGPIERASHLLPQIIKKRKFSYRQSVEGLRLILWGLFKKIVIADSMAPLVTRAFDGHDTASGLTLILGAIYFAIQIYGDFSGYSDIARGTAKLLGFELLINFKFPYFSRDIAEFWRRWHISLSSWFRDYLYIPLGGSKEGQIKSIRNTFVIFIVSGFWHGANWTYIFWGFLHALYFLPLLLQKRNRKNTGLISPDSVFPKLNELFHMLITFTIVVAAWIFFRANTISDAFGYIKGIFTNKFFIGNEQPFLSPYLILVISFLFIIEWMARNEDIEFVFSKFLNRYVRYFVYCFIVFMILMYGSFQETEFIYFQF